MRKNCVICGRFCKKREGRHVTCGPSCSQIRAILASRATAKQWKIRQMTDPVLRSKLRHANCVWQYIKYRKNPMLARAKARKWAAKNRDARRETMRHYRARRAKWEMTRFLLKNNFIAERS